MIGRGNIVIAIVSCLLLNENTHELLNIVLRYPISNIIFMSDTWFFSILHVAKLNMSYYLRGRH